MKLPKPAEMRKAIIAAAGVLAMICTEAIALGLLHGTTQTIVHLVAVALGGITARAVYDVPNAPANRP